MGAKGFTLTEVLVTVTIIAILASVAVPNLRKSIELGYRREAVDMLNTIYTGERTRFFESGSYNPDPAPGNGVLDASDDNDKWRFIFMDNPNLNSTPVTFTVSGDSGAFLATATRDADRSMTVSHQREWCDNSVPGSPESCWDEAGEWVVN